MKNEVQLFMNIYDILPHEALWEIIEDPQFPPEVWDKQDLIDSIREKGFINQLNIDPDGNIKNGNARYWIARKLLEEENDQRFLYLPVQRNFAAGHYSKNYKVKIDNPGMFNRLDGESKKGHRARVTQLTDKLISDESLKIWRTFQQRKDAVIPSKTAFEDYPIDKDNHVFLERHWEVCGGEYTTFSMKHPKNNDLVFVSILEEHHDLEQVLSDQRAEKMSKSISKYRKAKPAWDERMAKHKKTREEGK